MSGPGPTPASSYDLVVVGGGINGVGIARDAAGRGLSVLLVEQDDLAAHTSSASTKLIHGGLRYLEQYELRLVQKALAERERLLSAAPHLMWPLRFVMPHDAHLRPRWMIRAGLFLYDHLARRRRLPGSHGIDLSGHPAGAPLKAGFRRGFEYSDGWVDDARLVVLNAIDARERGATVLTRTRCAAAERVGGRWKLTLTAPAGEREVRCRALVNATGPWAAHFWQTCGGRPAHHRVRLVKGSHIVVPARFGHDYAYIFQAPDRRIVFALPYEGAYTLIGTTDIEHPGPPGRVTIDPGEVAYLCDMANRYFAVPTTPADVVWSYSGLRPLLEDEADDPASVTRDYRLELDAADPPALSVYGGKLTTYRVLAEQAVDRIAARLDCRVGPWTGGVPLPGGDLPEADFDRFLARSEQRWPWLPKPLVGRLARAYGTRIARILGAADGVEGLGAEVLPGLYAAELRHLVEEEWAETAEDILWRRSKLGLHLGPQAVPVLERWLRGRNREVHTRSVHSGRSVMPRYVLALDQGTTSSRSILFDHAGNVVAMAQREFTQHFPREGWVEHDADEIWATQSATIAEVLARAHASPRELAAVGITNQRETTVLWDRRTGHPVARAIVWQDRRTAERCDALRAAGHEPEVAERTGLLLDPYFSGTKLAWLLDRVPDARARAERGELCFGTVDTWLAWKLTGGLAHVTDPGNASRTLLLNLETGDWDPRMLALLGIPRACLPEIIPSSAARGLVARIAGHEVPLTGIAGDQQAALFGQRCIRPGMAKNTYGTGCFLLMHTGSRPLRSQHRLLSTVAWDVGERSYALEGSVFVAGAVVQWLRDGLGIIDRSAEVESLAASVPDSGGVYLVPAFTGLGAPHWDAYARGAVVGLTRGTTRAHLARAALEAIAYQSAEVLQAMQADAQQPLQELRVDGGATANDLLMQFQADLLGVPVVRPKVRETTALGAARLAGLAVGFWDPAADASGAWQVDRAFEPAIGADEAGERMRNWARAVARARAWVES